MKSKILLPLPRYMREFFKTGYNKQNSGFYLCSNPKKSRTMLVHIAKRIKVADGAEPADQLTLW